MSEAAAIRQRFYLLYEVQKYIPIYQWRVEDYAHAERYKQQCLALAESIPQAATLR